MNFRELLAKLALIGKFRKKSIIYLAFFLNCLSYRSLDAVERVDQEKTNQETRQGELFFEAKDYEEALAWYKELLRAPFPEWKKAILLYDIGTIELANQNWEEALKYFQQAEQMGVSFPPLQKNLAVQLVLAKFGLVKQQIQIMEPEQYFQISQLLKDLLSNLDFAYAATCFLARSEGEEDCLVSMDLQEIEGEAKRLFLQLQQTYFTYFASHASLQERLSLLCAVMKVFNNKIKFLKFASLENSLKSQYREIFLSEFTSWQPLWNILETQNREQQIPKKSMEVSSLFKNAQKAYMLTLNFLEESQFKKSLDALDSSFQELQKGLSLLIQSSSLKEIFNNLLNVYALALSLDPLQEIYLEGIANVLGFIDWNKIHQKEGISSYGPSHFLDLGKRSLWEGHFFQARIFVLLSRDLILNQLNEEENLENLLKKAIRKEEFSLELNKLKQRAEGKETQNEELERILFEYISHPVKLADQIFELMQKEQEKSYQSQKESKEVKLLWETFISLLLEGRKFASSAQKEFKPNLLSTDRAKLDEVLFMQQKAIETWKEALRQLKKISSLPSKSKQPEYNSSNENSQESFNSALQQLREMEREDRSHPILESSSTNQGKLKPW